MRRSATYTILIVRDTEGYVAFAPAFPNLIGRARTGRGAYALLKTLLKNRITELLDKGGQVPRDPVFQTRTFRLDLWELQAKGELV